MSTIKVDTIATRTGSGTITVSNDLANTGHASIGVSAVDASRALTVAGATDGSSGSGLVVYNSSLASKFAVRDDGLVSITNNATVGGTLGITGLVTASSGVSIGSGGSSNVIDDYEEGTWTAGISAGSGSIALQGSFQTGLYTKIGDMVYINLHMRVGSLSGNSGTLAITGLPFATPNDTKYRFSGVCSAHFGLTGVTTGDRLMPYMSSNSSNMIISNANGNSISSNSNSYMVANQSEMYLTMCYKTS